MWEQRRASKPRGLSEIAAGVPATVSDCLGSLSALLPPVLCPHAQPLREGDCPSAQGASLCLHPFTTWDFSFALPGNQTIKVAPLWIAFSSSLVAYLFTWFLLSLPFQEGFVVSHNKRHVLSEAIQCRQRIKTEH